MRGLQSKKAARQEQLFERSPEVRTKKRGEEYVCEAPLARAVTEGRRYQIL